MMVPRRELPPELSKALLIFKIGAYLTDHIKVLTIYNAAACATSGSHILNYQARPPH